MSVASSSETQSLLDRLDGSGSDSEWDAVRVLRAHPEFPRLLLEKYRRSRRWAARASCVYFLLGDASSNADALALGIEALSDKSKVVRYRATMLLAYSQNREALGPLRDLAKRGVSVEDAEAAIDAIESGNQHFFVDRTHSGMVFMNIERAR
jgi:hypothetical protein